MSTSANDLLVVEIDPGPHGGDIEILDAEMKRLPPELQRVHEDGRVSVELAPGAYRIRRWLGSDVQHMNALVLPGGRNTFEFDAHGAWRTAVPLAAASDATEAEIGGAVELSVGAAVRPAEAAGMGAHLLLFIRAGRDGHLGSRWRPRMSLHHASGRRVVDFDDMEPSTLGDTWCGFLLDVSPGTWRLRIPGDRGIEREMAVYLAPGWQTQVFLRVRTDDGGEMRPGLSGAAVLMSRAPQHGGAGFEPDDRCNVDGTLAIDALGRGRYLRGRPVSSLLTRKFKNPMLGIYAFWNLIRRARGAESEAVRDQIFGNVRGYLANLETVFHPRMPNADIEAIRLAIEPGAVDRVPCEAFEYPPMVADAWEVLIAATVDRPELAPPGCLSERIADRLVGTGTYLAWQIGRGLEGRAQNPEFRSTRKVVDAEELQLGLLRLGDIVNTAMSRQSDWRPVLDGMGVRDLVTAKHQEWTQRPVDGWRAKAEHLYPRALRSRGMLKQLVDEGPISMGFDEIEARLMDSLSSRDHATGNDIHAVVQQVGAPAGRVALAVETLEWKLGGE